MKKRGGNFFLLSFCKILDILQLKHRWYLLLVFCTANCLVMLSLHHLLALGKNELIIYHSFLGTCLALIWKRTVVLNIFFLLHAVFIKCCTCTYKRYKHDSLILNFRIVYSFHRCISGARFFKYSKSTCCFCQLGWCCHDNSWEDLGHWWVADELFCVCFLSSVSTDHVDNVWLMAI